MPIFICNNLYKTFNERNVLNNISCSFPNKGLVSICGKSGCGKSTFLNVLAGIEKPTSGEVLFCGKNICKFNDKKFSSYHLNDISIIFQHYNLFDELTVFDNVSIVMKMAKTKRIKERTEELLKRLSIFDLKDRKCSNLSGGEKQRVAICRALANNPKVILCDEPTGALDETNSRMIMDILKDISKSKLVILVSHNLDLINEYSDKTYEMKEGELPCCYERDEELSYQTEKHAYSGSFSNIFTYLLFKKKRTILSFASLLLGFTLLFVSIGFSIGSKNSEIKAFENCTSSYVGTISETTFIKIENSPLSFQKSKRPSAEVIDEKLNGKIEYEIRRNYSYFFSTFPLGKINGKSINDFEMMPVLDFPSNNYNEVIVNSQFADEFSATVGDTLTVSSSCDVSYKTNDPDNPFIKDSFSYSFDLKIIKIENEFAYLNSPRVYFSYLGIERELKNAPFEEISKYENKYVSVYNYLESSSDSEVYSSYSDYIFTNSSIEDYFKIIGDLENNKDILQIACNNYQVYNSYKSFVSTFSSALLIFVGIAFIGILLLLGFMSFSSFIQNKKQTAILTCIGSKNSSILSIYLNNSFIVLLLSLLISFLLSYPIQILINKIVYDRLLLESIITIPFQQFLGIPFGLLLSVFSISILVVLLFTAVPILFYRKINIADELRDE